MPRPPPAAAETQQIIKLLYIRFQRQKSLKHWQQAVPDNESAVDSPFLPAGIFVTVPMKNER